MRTNLSLANTEKLAYPLSADIKFPGNPGILPTWYLAKFLEPFSYSGHCTSNIYLWFNPVNPF